MSPAPGNGDITVVVPCFNYGRFLTEAIESVAAQDGGSPQIIVVDDGSTDPETVRVLAEAEERATVVRQENQGVCVARNRGFSLATTPFVLPLDADDRLAPGSLAALRAVLEADPELGYAYGYIEFFGERTGVMRMPPWDPWRLLFRHTVGPTALVRAEMIRDIGGYDPAFRHYEDWEIWLHALARGWRGRLVERPVLQYRKHGASKFDADRTEYRTLYRQLRRKHRSLYQDLGGLRARSALGPRKRALYRYVWGPRPWPAGLEAFVYGRLWSPRRTATTVR